MRRLLLLRRLLRECAELSSDLRLRDFNSDFDFDLNFRLDDGDVSSAEVE